jgi:hypothetical protein
MAQVVKSVADNGTSMTISGFLGDTVDTGAVTIATVNVTGTTKGETALNLSVASAGLGTEGGVEYDVADRTNATLTVGATSVIIRPPNRSVRTGANASFDVVVTNASGGVGSYGISVSLTNSSVASISTATDRTGAADVATNITGNGSEVTISGLLGDTNDTGKVTIATINVSGEVNGTTGMNVSIANAGLGDEFGVEYPVNRFENSTLTVVRLPALEGAAGRPTDPDSDGTYEDVNGDGLVRGSDAVSLFRAITRGDVAVTEYPKAFDFNGDGVARGSDAVTLFRAIVRDQEPASG